MKHSLKLTTAIEAVSKACLITRHVQVDLEKIGSLEKNDKSPVTVADFAAQAIVTHVLKSSLGSVDMVGEESSSELRKPDQQALCQLVLGAVQTIWSDATKDEMLDAIDLGNHDASAEGYWTLDPIDGTKGFLRGGQYAVSLAWIERGVVQMGVLGCPNLAADFDQPFDVPDLQGQIYIAQAGEGTWVIPADQPDATPIKLEADSAKGLINGLVRVCESVESGHSKHDDTVRIVEQLGGAGQSARLDSQCKYAVVARGQADAYLRLPTRTDYVEKIWDHAAGMLVAQEAGIVVSDITGKPLDFSQGAGLKNNRGVICASPQFHDQIIAAIADLGIGH